MIFETFGFETNTFIIRVIVRNGNFEYVVVVFQPFVNCSPSPKAELI